MFLSKHLRIINRHFKPFITITMSNICVLNICMLRLVFIVLRMSVMCVVQVYGRIADSNNRFKICALIPKAPSSHLNYYFGAFIQMFKVKWRNNLPNIDALFDSFCTNSSSYLEANQTRRITIYRIYSYTS